jgi:ZIP family zinc transporter
MAEALVWGLIATSSLVIGAVIAIVRPLGERIVGLVMAFGGGVLISAVAYELVEEAFNAHEGGAWVALGLAAGALVFYFGDLRIDRMGGKHRKRMTEDTEGEAKAIVLGTVLDGVPENLVLGLGLVTGGSVSAAMLAAVFLSNLPESVGSSAGLRRAGWSSRQVLLLWTVVALVTALAAPIGFGLLDNASSELLAFVMAFAAGSLLTMLSDSMMPQAFEHGGAAAGLMTTFGFGLAFAITSL